jgi:GAF domain-containing protein
MSADTLDLRLVVRRLVDDARERLAADAVGVWLRGGDGSELVLSVAVGFELPETTLRLAHRPSGRVGDWLVARRLPAAATLKRSEVSGDRAWLAAENIHALLAVPLTAESVPVGILAAFRRERPFPVGYLARAAGMAAMAAPAVHAAQQLEEQRARAERAETLLAVADTLAATSDLDAAMDQIARRTANALGAARCEVRLLRPTDAVDGPAAAAAAALVVPIARKGDVIGA